MEIKLQRITVFATEKSPKKVFKVDKFLKYYKGRNNQLTLQVKTNILQQLQEFVDYKIIGNKLTILDKNNQQFQKQLKLKNIKSRQLSSVKSITFYLISKT